MGLLSPLVTVKMIVVLEVLLLVKIIKNGPALEIENESLLLGNITTSSWIVSF